MIAIAKYFVFIFTFTIICSLAWAANGPILYFTFDKAEGSVVPDMSGGKHDGVLKEGAAIVTNNKKIGAGALQIKGGNETMEVKSFKELETYGDHTYLFWINFTNPTSGGWDQILVKPAPDSDRSPGLWVHTGGLGIHYRYNPGNLGANRLGPNGENSDFPQNQWNHIAGVKKGAELILYVNGVEKLKVAAPAAFAQGAREGMAGLYIGKSQSYAGPAAKFIIDDLAIYNRALNVAEVASLMGGIVSVAMKDKLTATWGKIKY